MDTMSSCLWHLVGNSWESSETPYSGQPAPPHFLNGKADTDVFVFYLETH